MTCPLYLALFSPGSSLTPRKRWTNLKDQMKKIIFFQIALSFLTSSCGWEPPVDWNVKSFLERSGYGYTVDPEGDFIVTVHLSAGRSQKVWLRSKLNRYQGSEIREVFSIAMEFQKEVPPQLVLNLMQDSYKNRLIGSWVLIREMPRDVYLLAFLAKVQGKTSSSLLGPAILEVAGVADQLELLKSGADRF